VIYAAFRAAHARFRLPPIKKRTLGTFTVKLVFATRPSALARWQTQWVITALQAAHPRLVCAEKVITTQGDKVLDRPLPEIGGKGLFTQELESELLSGAVHCAVHSLKDLPVENPAGLIVGCIPTRAEVRDALISGKGYSLTTLPTGAVVGTSSLRRAAQILAVRPDVTVQSLRGNVDTRLRKALDYSSGAGWTRDGMAAAGGDDACARAGCAGHTVSRRRSIDLGPACRAER
jgi:porphobilinogen deaminase